MLGPADREALEDVLAAARERGFLGPGPIGEHIDHAVAMAHMPAATPRRWCDLGSGAGVPALVLGLVWPDALGTLIEGSATRARWLTQACGAVGVAERCRVVNDRAEIVAQAVEHRERYDVVMARAFGPPAVTAECAAPLVRLGGELVVSEPPPDVDSEGRWPPAPLERLGLAAARAVHDAERGATGVVLAKRSPTPARYPRRTGVPAKRPLWETPRT